MIPPLSSHLLWHGQWKWALFRVVASWRSLGFCCTLCLSGLGTPWGNPVICLPTCLARRFQFWWREYLECGSDRAGSEASSCPPFGSWQACCSKDQGSVDACLRSSLSSAPEKLQKAGCKPKNALGNRLLQNGRFASVKELQTSGRCVRRRERMSWLGWKSSNFRPSLGLLAYLFTVVFFGNLPWFCTDLQDRWGVMLPRTWQHFQILVQFLEGWILYRFHWRFPWECWRKDQRLV